MHQSMQSGSMARGFGAAHVGGLPAKLVENPHDALLGSVIISANEHGGLSALELRIHHACAAHGIKRLHEMRVRKFLLEALHQRLVMVGEKLQHPVGGASAIGLVASITVLAMPQHGRDPRGTFPCPPHGGLGIINTHSRRYGLPVRHFL